MNLLNTLRGLNNKKSSNEVRFNNLTSFEGRITDTLPKKFHGQGYGFWRVINNCEPENLLLELLNQGVHHECNKTFFYLQQNNNAKIERWSFENRLNNILSLLGDKWLDQSQTAVKKMLNNIIKENIPAKCS